MKPVYLRTSKVLRLTPLQTAATIVLPAILPEVMSGHAWLSLTLLGVLIGEMFASRRGSAFSSPTRSGSATIATIMAVAVLLAVFAVAANAALSPAPRLHR